MVSSSFNGAWENVVVMCECAHVTIGFRENFDGDAYQCNVKVRYLDIRITADVCINLCEIKLRPTTIQLELFAPGNGKASSHRINIFICKPEGGMVVVTERQFAFGQYVTSPPGRK